MFERGDKLDQKLYVITPVFNAARFRSRWRLFEDFRRMVEQSGAILYVVEVAFGDRDFVVTSPHNPRDIQMRTFQELWLKENIINLGVQRLPLGWQKMAWIDGDVHFARYDWYDETLHQLEHHPVVQMWSTLHDLNSNHELVGTIRSFADVWLNGGPKIEHVKPPHPVHPPHPPHPPHPHGPDYPYPYPEPNGHDRKGYPGAPGLAWAMRREAWQQLGGLIDYCILGAGDWYMAHALTGQANRVIKPNMGRLGEKILQWEDRARKSLWEERPILGNLGVVKGMALHY